MIVTDEKNRFAGDEIDVSGLKNAFDSIKEEFDDHLDAINGNTVEIKELEERLNITDLKIEKLSDRIETIYMMLSQSLNQKERFKNVILSSTEQKIFLGTYLENDAISYSALSRKLAIKRPIIKMAIESMRKKNIPFFLEQRNGEIYVFMEPGFKEMQAKEQIIRIDEKNLKNLYVKDLRYFF